MELYEKIFDGVAEFNNFLNRELIKRGIRIIPITVVETINFRIKVYYTIDEIES
jgi:hypothetical protein